MGRPGNLRQNLMILHLQEAGVQAQESLQPGQAKKGFGPWFKPLQGLDGHFS